MTRSHSIRGTTAALGIAAALLLTGCTSTRASVSAGPTASAPAADVAQTTTVTRATVVGVLTKTGMVVQGASFQLHARITGTITAITSSTVTITPDGGDPAVVTLPAGAKPVAALVQRGDRVVQGIALIEATYPGFSIQLTLEAADLLRLVTPPLGIRAQVTGGSGPFDCTLLDPTPSTSALQTDSATPAATGTSLVCGVPETATVLAGMGAITVIQLERAENALVLPVEAVAGTVDSGSVYLLGPNGDPVETRVALGTTDGTRIVITSGVAEGDTVYIPGPWIGGRDD